MKAVASVFLVLIRGYRLLLSPLLPRSCRFHPSCSEYAEEAFRTLPIHAALYRSARRVLRCHPFHPGGYDPVHH